jgi:prepilin-type N-terminal cleavage/methylation domain-containing protein
MRLPPRHGFTLIELVIAAFIFAVGALALEATAVASLRRMRRSADLAFAASIARSRLEVLAAARCDALAGGTDDVRGFVSSWTVEPTALPSVRAVSQTVAYALDGRPRIDTYRAMIPCSE